jgi:hypothetical protein
MKELIAYLWSLWLHLWSLWLRFRRRHEISAIVQISSRSELRDKLERSLYVVGDPGNGRFCGAHADVASTPSSNTTPLTAEWIANQLT